MGVPIALVIGKAGKGLPWPIGRFPEMGVPRVPPNLSFEIL